MGLLRPHIDGQETWNYISTLTQDAPKTEDGQIKDDFVIIDGDAELTRRHMSYGTETAALIITTIAALIVIVLILMIFTIPIDGTTTIVSMSVVAGVCSVVGIIGFIVYIIFRIRNENVSKLFKCIDNYLDTDHELRHNIEVVPYIVKQWNDGKDCAFKHHPRQVVEHKPVGGAETIVRGTGRELYDDGTGLGQRDDADIEKIGQGSGTTMDGYIDLRSYYDDDKQAYIH